MAVEEETEYLVSNKFNLLSLLVTFRILMRPRLGGGCFIIGGIYKDEAGLQSTTAPGSCFKLWLDRSTAVKFGSILQNISEVSFYILLLPLQRLCCILH